MARAKATHGQRQRICVERILPMSERGFAMGGYSNMLPRPAAADRQRGFNLVELMIAMTIGLFIVTGVGYIFTGTKQTFNSMEALGVMQENARFAFEFMGKDIRMAGYTGGADSDWKPSDGGYPGDVGYSGDVERLADLYGQASDGSGKPYGPLRGYESTETSFLSGRGVYANTDALAITRADSEHSFDLSAEPTSQNYVINCPPDGIPEPKQGELLVVSDYTCSKVVEAGTGTTPSTSNCSSTWTVDVGSSLSCFSGNWKSRTLSRLRGAIYFIADDASGEPNLKRLELTHSSNAPSAQEQPIIEGIKDLQIQYGEDTSHPPDGDGSVDTYVDATSVGNWDKVLSVRITLTLVSSSGKRLTTDGSNGGLLEKDFTTTIAIRNRL